MRQDRDNETAAGTAEVTEGTPEGTATDGFLPAQEGDINLTGPEGDQQLPQDAGEEQVQAEADKAAEQGFFGEKADPTPNEAYTMQGRVNDEPTPETSPEQAALVGSRKFVGGTGTGTGA